MKSRIAAACVLVVLIGAAAASAGSSNVNVQGSIKDSDGGRVSMTIKVKKTRDANASTIPSKATNIKLINVPYVCNDGSTGSMNGETGSAKITFDAEVSRFEFFDNDQAGPQLLFEIFGIVCKDGKKVTGKASVAFAETTNGVTLLCSTSDIGINAGAFTAKK